MSVVVIAVAGLAIAGIAFATYKAPRLTSAVLWSLVATLLLTAGLLLILPGPFSEVALWLSLAVPLIWAALQFWCYWDENKWRVAGGLITLALIGGAVTYFVDPPI